jgi:hypothetical protein
MTRRHRDNEEQVVCTRGGGGLAPRLGFHEHHRI